VKTSSKWVIGVVVILGIFAYRYYQEHSCYLLTVRIIPYALTDEPQQVESLAEKLAPSSVRDIYCSSQPHAHTLATTIGAKLHVPVIVDDRLKERSSESLRDYAVNLISFFKDRAKEYKPEVYVVVHQAMINDLLEYLEVPKVPLPTSCCSLTTYVYNPCSGHIAYNGFEEI
jgi:broad specificity phosphatase PhoE